MLYPKNSDWIHKQGELKKLSCVKLQIDSAKENVLRTRRLWRKNLKSILHKLPYNKNTLEANLSLLCNSSMYDGNIYALKEVEEKNDGNEFILKVSNRYSYFDFVNTCLLLGYEAGYASLKQNSVKNMKVRSSKSFDPFVFTNRAPIVGLITLVVLKGFEDKDKKKDNENKKKNVFILHKRSDDVAECKNLISSIPGGTVQPVIKDKNMDDDTITLGSTFIREYGEELMGIDEYTELSNPEELKKIYSEDNIDDEMYFLGMAVNPINLYLEVMSLIVIDMDVKKSKFTEEALQALGVRKNNETNGDIMFEDFNESNINHYANSHFCTPALKQIMRIVAVNFNEIEKLLV